MKFWVFSMFLF